SAQQGQETKAFELYMKALVINPENIVALFGLVQVSHVLGRTAEAIAPLAQYLELSPGKSEVRYALSGCLVACGRTDEAKGHLRTLLEMDPANASATELLAQL
ncbi:MAG: tetratricopeptide repeat protein, partial [Desulfomicrobium sp.]|nr:tetratricopeptide repeat protein [Desulfomicrobium sp.]